MRLFIALDIDPGIRERIATFRNQMRQLAPNVRWVGPETFHITLQFLGETTKLDEIRHALQQASSPPTQIAFLGAGFFPNSKSPRVFWVGIEGDRRLQDLVSAISKALLPLGFGREPGPFTPHLTLARSGSGRPRPVPGERPALGLQQVRAKLEALPQPEFGTMTAREFCLYESHLSPAGPRYEKLAICTLRKPLIDPLILEEDH